MAVGQSAGRVERTPAKTNILNDAKFRSIVFQIIVCVLVVWAVWTGITNMIEKRAASGFPLSWDFWSKPAGFPMTSLIVDYDVATATNWIVYKAALFNTLLLAAIGIVFATILGFLIGIGRLSNNWVIRKVCAGYVEIMRNIPLLLHIYIWAFGVLVLLPSVKDSFRFGFLGSWTDNFFGYLNDRGYWGPKFIFDPGFTPLLIAFVVGILASICIAYWAKQRQMATGERFPVLWTSLGLLIGLPVLTYLVLGMSLDVEHPKAGRFNLSGGTAVPKEFLAMLFALSIYTAGFIAEIVRAGILAVARGQTEAANALGLRGGPTLRLVVIPQAMRVIIPPLTSQYLNLTKNSSLGGAISYWELTHAFAGTAANKGANAIEFVAVTMATYLVISLITSLIMNVYNHMTALVER